jgi:hypothetical protein
VLGRTVEDALDLAAVDVEFSGYGSLAAARFVPHAYGLLQSWWDMKPSLILVDMG